MASSSSRLDRARLGRTLLALASIGHILAYLYAAPEHVVDPQWPAHAQFHVLQAIFWVVGFDLVVLCLVLGPLARAERWVQWVLVLAGLCLHGVYFLALLRGGGPPELLAHVGLGGLLVLYGVGLALAWQRRASPGSRHHGVG